MLDVLLGGGMGILGSPRTIGGAALREQAVVSGTSQGWEQRRRVPLGIGAMELVHCQGMGTAALAAQAAEPGPLEAVHSFLQQVAEPGMELSEPVRLFQREEETGKALW